MLQTDWTKVVGWILDDPKRAHWTVQGFGMLRTYLTEDERVRLHIWDPGQAVDDVSVVHTHPWDLESHIISGVLSNQRYVMTETPWLGESYRWSDLRTGEGGHLKSTGGRCTLRKLALESYGAGDTYSQTADEIHSSHPDPGCVTVVERTFTRERDHARTFWQTGDWVSAEPRVATDEEVAHFINLARSTWTAT